jgi:exodeoxyribonuclease-3
MTADGREEGSGKVMRVATWNVNSVKQRLSHLLAFLADAQPDVLCLQELKCVDEAFPRQRGRGGGLQRRHARPEGVQRRGDPVQAPLEDVRRGLPGDPTDEQARYVEGVISTGSGALRVASLYLPNGNPVGTQNSTTSWPG